MAQSKKKAAPQITEQMLTILLAPVITEKAANGSAYSQVTFKVAKDATKPQIKAAVEALYKVDVRAVNTLISKGKTKRFKGRLGQRSDVKKAIVTLKDGQMLDLSASV
ncbi:MAG: 50S ribosomal protein L23 [Pseudomonadota bacterium]